MYFDFDDEEKDYMEYDISSIFGRLPKDNGEPEKKEYNPDSPATADEFRTALNIMAGGEDIFDAMLTEVKKNIINNLGEDIGFGFATTRGNIIGCNNDGE